MSKKSKGGLCWNCGRFKMGPEEVLPEGGVRQLCTVCGASAVPLVETHRPVNITGTGIGMKQSDLP